MIRHRVSMIITADELTRPVSFRVDLILMKRDPERARVYAKGALVDQGPLTCAKMISSTVDMIELPTHPQESQQ